MSATGGAGRRAVAVRGGLVLAVLAAVGFGVAGPVVAATPSFTVDEPRPDQAVTAGAVLRASGVPGDATVGSLWVLASQRSPSAGTDLYTVGGRATFAHGRWEGTVRPPAGRSDAPVAVVIVRADPSCGTQLEAVDAPQRGAGRLYGPLPEGCTALATVAVRSTGG